MGTFESSSFLNIIFDYYYEAKIKSEEIFLALEKICDEIKVEERFVTLDNKKDAA